MKNAHPRTLSLHLSITLNRMEKWKCVSHYPILITAFTSAVKIVPSLVCFVSLLILTSCKGIKLSKNLPFLANILSVFGNIALSLWAEEINELFLLSEQWLVHVMTCQSTRGGNLSVSTQNLESANTIAVRFSDLWAVRYCIVGSQRSSTTL